MKMISAQMFPNIKGYQYILPIQNIFVEKVFCSFLRQQNVWKIYSINIYGRVSNFLIYDQKKSDSQMENIQIVKSLSRPKEVVANNSTR